jgi:class 3 adenylate cyclase
MTVQRKYAEKAALAELFPAEADAARIADVIEQTLTETARAAEAYVTVGNFGSQQRMDYTIIGNGVNMTARLQSHAELDGIIIGHETYSLVKDEIDTEEQPPIKVKGFADPIRCYKVLGIYDDLAEQGLVIREQREGFKLLLDPQKEDKATVISTLEAIRARLKH